MSTLTEAAQQAQQAKLQQEQQLCRSMAFLTLYEALAKIAEMKPEPADDELNPVNIARRALGWEQRS